MASPLSLDQLDVDHRLREARIQPPVVEGFVEVREWLYSKHGAWARRLPFECGAQTEIDLEYVAPHRELRGLDAPRSAARSRAGSRLRERRERWQSSSGWRVSLPVQDRGPILIAE